MKLRYTPEARADVREMQEYIRETLKNPLAANRIAARILESCSRLKDLPQMGATLAEKVGRETDLRYLISGKYIVFYRVEDAAVSVIRILDGRTNYMRALFHEQD